MTISREVTLPSLEATRAEAESLARQLRGGQTIAFSGDLGTGKTTFIFYLCAALGARVAASSPTYVLQHEYKTNSDLLIEHWDLYRLKELPAELEEEAKADTIRLIEWAERFPDLERQASLRIRMYLENETSRSISISGLSA